MRPTPAAAADPRILVILNPSAQSEKAKHSIELIRGLSDRYTSIMLNDEDMSGMAISMDFMTDKLNEAIEEQDSTDTDEKHCHTSAYSIDPRSVSFAL